MKKITFILFALFAGTAFAQTTADATVNAAIVSPLSLEGGDNLNFGSVVEGTAGTVIVAADGGRTGTAEAVTASSTSPASFTVNAANNYSFTITIADITLSHATEADLISVTDFNHNHPTLTGTGADVEFNVGGTLNVEADDSEGIYEGTVTVSVDYQ